MKAPLARGKAPLTRAESKLVAQAPLPGMPETVEAGERAKLEMRIAEILAGKSVAELTEIVSLLE